MADGNSDTFLGVILGTLLIGVIAIGGFLYLGHRSAPTAPAVSVSLSAPAPAPAPTH